MHDFTGKTVGVFFGGKSPEHDISIVTGLLVLDELKKLGIHTEPVYVGTDGAWCLDESLRDREVLRNIHTQDLYSMQRWFLDTRHRTPQLVLTRRPSFFSRRERRVIDIVFPTFHGAYGEDGCFQGLCEMLGVPYVGCAVEGSTVAMNKILTKKFFQIENVPTTPFVGFSQEEWGTQKIEILKTVTNTLTFPVFVKPAHAGSSIGISRVKSPEALESAIETSFQFDTHTLVENGVAPVKDLTCCLREGANGTIEASLIQDSGFGKSDFFTYEEKYLNNGGAQLGAAQQQIEIPANVPSEITKRTVDASIKIFRDLGLSGIARVDFLFNPDTQELFANEINPLPGTIYAHLWKKTGVEAGVLVTDLLYAAVRKHHESIKKNRYFPSSLLADIRGKKFAK